MKPLVSVIIPVHNGEKYLAEAIQSVLKQTYLNYEIWVIDNGSVDESAKIALSFSSVNYIYDEIADVNRARNKGVSLSRGEYIAFLDQDDTWEFNKLETQVHFLEMFKNYDVVIGLTRFYLQNGCAKPHWLKRLFLEVPQLTYTPSVVLVRKTVFGKTHFFDEKFQVASDVDWFFKIKYQGILIGEIDQILLNRRIHDKNASDNVDLTQKELLSVIRKSLKSRRFVDVYE